MCTIKANFAFTFSRFLFAIASQWKCIAIASYKIEWRRNLSDIKLNFSISNDASMTYVHRHLCHSNVFHMVDKIQLNIHCNWFRWYCVDNFDTHYRLGFHQKCIGLNGHCSCMLPKDKNKIRKLFVKLHEATTVFPYIHIRMADLLYAVSIQLF